MSNQALINGVDVEELGQKAAALKQQPELGKFTFRVHNRWIDGGHNETVVDNFTGVGQEHEHLNRFVLEAGEPPVLLGQDEAPNPVEHLLNALVTCLTTSMVYHAAVRGISISELRSTVKGDMDVRGFMGLTDKVRKGYENIEVTFKVKSDGTPELLEECARFSPVFDTVSRGTNVELRIEPM